MAVFVLYKSLWMNWTIRLEIDNTPTTKKRFMTAIQSLLSYGRSFLVYTITCRRLDYIVKWNKYIAEVSSAVRFVTLGMSRNYLAILQSNNKSQCFKIDVKGKELARLKSHCTMNNSKQLSINTVSRFGHAFTKKWRSYNND